MAAADDLTARLLARFGAEADRRVEVMQRDLRLLRAGTDAATGDELLEELLHEAHSLRGAARAAGVERVETVAQQLEELFELVRKGEVTADPAACDVFEQAAQAAGELAREATGDQPAAVDVERIATLLAGITRGDSAAAPPPPGAGVTGGDIVGVPKSKLQELLAAVGALAAADTAARERLVELGRVASELNELLRTPGPHPHADQPPATAPRASMVVLLVENSETTRVLQKHLLERAGYEMRLAGDGSEAWNLLQVGDVKIVVSDIVMPGMDGFELTAKIRGDPKQGGLPVILMTSSDTPERRARSAEVGASAYIVKGSPEHEDLVRTIERVARGSPAAG